MEHDLLSAAFLSALFTIVLLDLVLAGDNALVIGIVARNLPRDDQRKVILCGALGAIAARAAMAVLVVQVLDLPGFMLVGAIALVWIARKLLAPDTGASAGHHVKAPAATFVGAIRTIVITDAVMGIDNVLAIGGAAHGSTLLIVMGLGISAPIIVWGSQLVIRLVGRFPPIILLGGGVLAWTAWSMIVREPLLAPWFADRATARLGVAMLIFSISLSPWYSPRLAAPVRPLVALLPALLVGMLGFEAAASLWSGDVDDVMVTTSGDDLRGGTR